MAEDLARCFEFNASRFQSTFEQICQKYDREFPDDDIVELRHNRIIHDRGVLKAMKPIRLGYATFEKHGKHRHLKADTPSCPSWLDPGGCKTSPEASEKSFLSTSEKSFISVNCSRWANDIEEESEPSDAETLTSGSEDDDDDDRDSWEDETEESVPVKEADIRGEDADLHVSDHGSEEEDGWLTIGDRARLSRRVKHSVDQKPKPEHPHTGHHHSFGHKSSSKRDGFVGTSSPQTPRHEHPTTHHRGSTNSRSREDLSRPSLWSGDLTQRDVIDRIGPPRRVKPVRLFSPSSSSEEVSDDFSKEPRPFTSGDNLGKVNSNVRKVFSETGRERRLLEARAKAAREAQSACRSSFSSGCDDVDSHQPCGSPTDTDHLHVSPSENDGILTSQNMGYKGKNRELDNNEGTQREPRAFQSSPRPTRILESTFTVSKHNPLNTALTKDSRQQIPKETDVISFTSEDDDDELVMNTQFRYEEDVDGEPDCKKSGTEVVCAALPSERRQPPTQSYGSQCRRMELDSATTRGQRSQLPSCGTLKATEHVPGLSQSIPTEQTPVHGSTAWATDPVQDVDLKRRETSLMEIKKNLDRLAAIFSSPGSLIPERLCTPARPSLLGESAVTEGGKELDAVLGSAAQPEMMDMSPVRELNEKPDSPSSIFPEVTPSMTDMSKTPKECSREMGGERLSLSDKTFIVSDKADCKHTKSDGDPLNFYDPVLSIDSSTSSARNLSLQKESKTKRKFCPAYKPFSTEEIQESLEADNSESFVDFLKAKQIKNKPQSVTKSDSCVVKSYSTLQNEIGKERHPDSPQLTSETKPFSTKASFSSPQSLCKPEVSRCAECCQVLKDDIKMIKNDMADFSGKVNISSTDLEMWRKNFSLLTSKISSQSPKIAESKLQIKNLQTAQCLSHETVNQHTVFQATPGQMFRETIRSLHMPPRATETDLPSREGLNEKVSAIHKGCEDQGSLKGEHRDVKMQSCCKGKFISSSRGQTTKSARRPEPESGSLSAAAMTSSPSAEEKQRRLPGSAANSLFLQMKQSAESKTPPTPQCGLSASVEEQVPCQRHHKACCASVHQCRNSGCHTHEADLSRADSAVGSDRWDQGRLLLLTASGDNPLSLLSKMDSLNSAPAENIQQKTNRETGHNPELSKRESSLWKVTMAAEDSTNHKMTVADPAHHTGSLSRATRSTPVAQQTQKDCDDDMHGRACVNAEPLSHQCKMCSSAPAYQRVKGQGGGGARSPHQQGTKAARTVHQTDQHRTQAAPEKSNSSLNSYSYDSLCVAPQGRSLDANQSTTPSKLLNKLNLSDSRSPLNMTKNCDKLSRLLLDSPEERKVGSTSHLQPRYDRQLKLGEELDTPQQKGSSLVAADQTQQPENPSWKIFKSKSRRPAPHVAAVRSESPLCYRFSSPQKDSTDVAGNPVSKPNSERKMIRISSPQARKMLSSSFSSDLPRPTSFTYKRSFESELDPVNCATNRETSSISSPLKRRRLDAAHGTSTPSKSDSGWVKFDMDESLSTIAGESSDLNSTVNSSDIFVLDDGDPCSEEEDEITLVPE